MGVMEFLYLFMWSFLTLLFTSHPKTGLLLEGLVLRTACIDCYTLFCSCRSGEGSSNKVSWAKFCLLFFWRYGSQKTGFYDRKNLICTLHPWNCCCLDTGLFHNLNVNGLLQAFTLTFLGEWGDRSQVPHSLCDLVCADWNDLHLRVVSGVQQVSRCAPQFLLGFWDVLICLIIWDNKVFGSPFVMKEKFLMDLIGFTDCNNRTSSPRECDRGDFGWHLVSFFVLFSLLPQSFCSTCLVPPSWKAIWCQQCLRYYWPGCLSDQSKHPIPELLELFLYLKQTNLSCWEMQFLVESIQFFLLIMCPLHFCPEWECWKCSNCPQRRTPVWKVVSKPCLMWKSWFVNTGVIHYAQVLLLWEAST